MTEKIQFDTVENPVQTASIDFDEVIGEYEDE